jgi:ABC-type oligopeptide transport system ATPase subunit
MTSVVRHISDRIAVMYPASWSAGADAEIFKNPQHPYTAALMRAGPSPIAVHTIDGI